IPTATLSAVIATAARTELAATERFSARIASEPNAEPVVAGNPVMPALSIPRTVRPSARRNTVSLLYARSLHWSLLHRRNPLKTSLTTLVCLLRAAARLGQSSSTVPPLKQRTSPTTELPVPEAPSVAADDPVITVQGLCERPGGGSATPADCKTVVTRADFEKLVPPNTPRKKE